LIRTGAREEFIAVLGGYDLRARARHATDHIENSRDGIDALDASTSARKSSVMPAKLTYRPPVSSDTNSAWCEMYPAS
jgi:hypothetical protein